MDLFDAATYFDNEIFQDYFDDSVTFYGQMRPFTESTRSGPATQRRVLSVDPDISMPTRRVIKMVSTGKVYIVGARNEDYWFDEMIRKEYPTVPVNYQATVGNIGNFLSDTGLTENIFVFSTYVRRVPLEEESSLFFAGHEFYFSSVDVIPNDSLIRVSGEYYRVKVPSSIDGAGFGMCEAVRLDAPMTTVTYTSKSAPYDPINDVYVPTILTGVAAFVEPLRFNFEFSYPSFDRVEPGDKAISVLKSAVAVAKVGDEVDDQTVLSVRDETTYWILHCR